MWYAAVENKTVRLTALGTLYCQNVKVPALNAPLIIIVFIRLGSLIDHQSSKLTDIITLHFAFVSLSIITVVFSHMTLGFFTLLNLSHIFKCCVRLHNNTLLLFSFS